MIKVLTALITTEAAPMPFSLITAPADHRDHVPAVFNFPATALATHQA